MLLNELKGIGLSEKEAKVYLASLELGETNISRIAKQSKIKRTTTYLIVDSLKEKGLISEIKKKGKSLFYAEDPRTIEELLEEKKNKLKRIMPELLSFTNLIDKKPKIKYLEGDEGIKNAYKDILKFPNSELLSLYSDDAFVNFSESFFEDYFFKKRVEKKIFARTIMPESEITKNIQARDQEHLRKAKLVSPDIFNIKIEISIYGKNRVAIMSFKEKFSLIIESKLIHDSLKSMFELIWSKN